MLAEAAELALAALAAAGSWTQRALHAACWRTFRCSRARAQSAPEQQQARCQQKALQSCCPALPFGPLVLRPHRTQ
jgi:hypothetical protein